ncbi:MAG: hypothetical protein HOP30_00035 [Cyclobacteriaceae bacterium]|nr:hypothetical protein [Cyclobacteriaceae bacterium]
MRKNRIQHKRKIISKEKRIEKIHYRIFIALLISWLAYHLFLRQVQVGGDYRYTLYVFFLPTMLGMVVLAVYRNKHLVQIVSESKSLLYKFFVILFYTAQGFLVSYVSFGLMSEIVFDFVNREEQSKNPLETIICSVTDFHFSRRGYPKIYFTYEGITENVPVSNSQIDEYYESDPANYVIALNVRQGIWNYYRVYDWEIQPKEH